MTDDVDAMVEAVLDVLAPQVDGPPGFAPVRYPLIRFDADGLAVRPSEEQLLALAERIVHAVRAAVPGRPVWVSAGGGQERPVAGGLTGRIEPSIREPGRWSWLIQERTVHGRRGPGGRVRARPGRGEG